MNSRIMILEGMLVSRFKMKMRFSESVLDWSMRVARTWSGRLGVVEPSDSDSKNW